MGSGVRGGKRQKVAELSSVIPEENKAMRDDFLSEQARDEETRRAAHELRMAQELVDTRAHELRMARAHVLRMAQELAQELGASCKTQ